MNIANSYCLACTTKPTQFEDEPPFMPVLDNFERYRPFLGVKRYKERVFENKQLALFNLLKFCFKRTLDFGNLPCANEFEELA